MSDAFAGSGITVLLIGAVGWLFRTWIKERLTASLRFEIDGKLEELKASLQRANESLAAATLAGQTAFSQTHAVHLPYKIKAIEAVWASITAWNEYVAVSTFIAILPIDWVRKYGADPKTKENFEIMLRAPEHLAFMKERNRTELERPFLSERSWALYSAYYSLCSSRLMKASMFLFPTVDHAKIWEAANERDLIKAAAPQGILNQYDKNPILGGNAFLSYVKEQILDEFRRELSGARASESATENTAAILAAATALAEKSKAEPSLPTDGEVRLPE